MFSSKDNMFGYSSSSSNSPWTDTMSWETSLAHNGGLAHDQYGTSLSDLDLFALATTPGQFIFDQSTALPTPPSSSNSSLYDSFYSPDFTSSPPPGQAQTSLTSTQVFPTTDFVLFPEGPQSCATSYTPPPQPQVALQRSVTVSESAAAVRAAKHLIYVDKATSTAHDQPAERPNKRIKITRTPPVTEKRKKPRHDCKLGKCSRSFGRNSDLVRHQQDWHGLSDKFYECEADACLYRTRRNDKMKEHCQRMHGHLKGTESFSVIPGRKDESGEVGGAKGLSEGD
ncbi:hypothetical protein M409DRAFT_56804 [Zasmidium cellare ATCC 36951]|uniref:C2H2-type domain-containing protein n=1 Tax=Zasmidium cellare ATCC 36951 TaxID=1080233 RepID=A0A6A6CA95_ZASCE|nr:uncharacterized protein M409DRAFT_56804 [Zasmidium cellare ATCC 36951]KAF2164084.1 hypothetical protein M409DRAFT_56804 [Zasmidium cellare ATCC 36951]